MIKPDGLRDQRIHDRISELLESCESKVERRWDHELDQAQIERLWPQYFDNDCPITVRFLTRYLMELPVQIVTVVGESSEADTRAIKRRIRSEFATSPFSNCVHAPDDSVSAAEQLRILDHSRDEAIEISPFPVFERPLDTLMGQSSSILDEVVEELWRDAWSRGWEGVWPSPPVTDDPSVDVILVSDTEHTLDFAISSLLFAVPQLGLKDAISSVLRTSLEGSAIVCQADAVSARRICDVLRATSLRVELRSLSGAVSLRGSGERD